MTGRGGRRARRCAVAVSVAFALVLAAPSAQADPAPGLAALQADLDAATASAQQLADDLDRSAAGDAALQAALEDLQAVQDDAHRRLAARVRQLYIDAGPRALDGWGEVVDPGRAALAGRGVAGGLREQRDLIETVTGRSAQVRELRARAEQLRTGLRLRAVAVLAEQERARTLLDQARAALAAQQAQAEQAAEAARLAASQAALDAVSASVTRALASPAGLRGRQAVADEEPVLALLEATGRGYPAGWRPSGQVERGEASWYGPGFVGSPTASGRPYDPERLSCAHKTLPLGTVVHVTSGGRATNCLVDDRGPYVDGRVLDLSRAGARALGFDGVAPVTVEVLRPDG